jgi:lysine 2,3-aminomutase
MIESPAIHARDVDAMLTRYHFSDETRRIIEQERLLPPALLHRLHLNFPQQSRFFRTDDYYFSGKTYYNGLTGFREIVAALSANGIEISDIKEREFFIEVYRFLATRHVLNSIDWTNYEQDTMYQLVFPQPGMIPHEDVQRYIDAATDEERRRVVEEYTRKTNPHDGKQMLNKPWFLNDDGQLEILQGCQHKYPPIALVFDRFTQNCFAFCTYCFRHAQVRGDEDMFVQDDVAQLHLYLRNHKEITDILITGGDGGFIHYDRLAEYVLPLLADPTLAHIRTLRFGSRALTFHPELLLTDEFENILALLQQCVDSGMQVIWVAHLSTPRDILNPGTIAAIRRLKAHGVAIKSQSPIMKHISLFTHPDGSVDVERSARNWIDLGNLLGMLGVGFHSMYCARPTGEHHYFTAPLADIDRIFSKVYKSLSSVNRPSRYITMTSSAGKISLLGTAEVNGETVFALKFNEGRNMDWMDRVYLARYDEKENTIEKLLPYQGEKHFYEDECTEIEQRLAAALQHELDKAGIHDQ